METTIGLIGLGVMGSNLALNMMGHGYAVAGFDHDSGKRDAFAARLPASTTSASVASIPEVFARLTEPRCVFLMIPAGPALDHLIETLRVHLQAGDIVVDGGNTLYSDTDRRCVAIEDLNGHYLGMGISGGEEGARRGPALMPGGSRLAYEQIRPLLDAIAARAPDGAPCVAFMGPRGAGHYVKMVHNAIEYGDMQLIAEAYDLLHRGAGLSAGDIARHFEEWDRGELQSYLMDITVRILRTTDPLTDKPLIDVILDEAQQKGTGRWASQDALSLGVAVPTLTTAVDARVVSSLRNERLDASRILRGPEGRPPGAPATLVGDVRAALYASKIASYAQGFALLRMASVEYGYGIDASEVARIWRAGCIIRAGVLDEIRLAFHADAGLTHLLIDPSFSAILNDHQTAWRRAVSTAVLWGIPVPAMSASLAYFDSFRSARLPANLIQAQRDYFGAHTYHRLDRPGVFHTNWA